MGGSLQAHTANKSSLRNRWRVPDRTQPLPEEDAERTAKDAAATAAATAAVGGAVGGAATALATGAGGIGVQWLVAPSALRRVRS